MKLLLGSGSRTEQIQSIKSRKKNKTQQQSHNWHSDLCGNPMQEKTYGALIVSILIIQGRITIVNTCIQPSSPHRHIVLHSIVSFSHTLLHIAHCSLHLYGYAHIYSIYQTVRQIDYNMIHQLHKLFIVVCMRAHSIFSWHACNRMGN